MKSKNVIRFILIGIIFLFLLMMNELDQTVFFDMRRKVDKQWGLCLENCFKLEDSDKVLDCRKTICEKERSENFAVFNIEYERYTSSPWRFIKLFMEAVLTVLFIEWIILWLKKRKNKGNNSDKI